MPDPTMEDISTYCCMDAVSGGCPHPVGQHEPNGRCLVGYGCPCTQLRRHREACAHWPAGVTE